jgi:hypothetical protein
MARVTELESARIILVGNRVVPGPVGLVNGLHSGRKSTGSGA